jgi:hypothetical protein
MSNPASRDRFGLVTADGMSTGITTEPSSVAAIERWKQGRTASTSAIVAAAVPKLLHLGPAARSRGSSSRA